MELKQPDLVDSKIEMNAAPAERTLPLWDKGKKTGGDRRKEAVYLFKYLLLVNFIEYLEAGAVPALLMQLKTSFQMSSGELGLLGGIVYLSLSCGGPVAGFLLRHLDHKHTIGIAVIVNNIFTLIWALTPVGLPYSAAMFIILRFCMGFTQCVICIFMPLWTNEFAPKESKTKYMSFLQASVPLGVMIGYVIASLISNLSQGSDTCYGILCWRWPFLIEVFLLLPFCFGYYFIPRSHFSVRVTHTEAGRKSKVKSQSKHSKYLQGDFERGLTAGVSPPYQADDGTITPTNLSYSDDQVGGTQNKSVKQVKCDANVEEEEAADDDEDSEDDYFDHKFQYAKAERNGKRGLRRQAVSTSLVDPMYTKHATRGSFDDLARLDQDDDVVILMQGSHWNNNTSSAYADAGHNRDGFLTDDSDQENSINVEFGDYGAENSNKGENASTAPPTSSGWSWFASWGVSRGTSFQTANSSALSDFPGGASRTDEGSGLSPLHSNPVSGQSSPTRDDMETNIDGNKDYKYTSINGSTVATGTSVGGQYAMEKIKSSNFTVPSGRSGGRRLSTGKSRSHSNAQPPIEYESLKDMRARTRQSDVYLPSSSRGRSHSGASAIVPSMLSTSSKCTSVTVSDQTRLLEGARSDSVKNGSFRSARSYSNSDSGSDDDDEDDSSLMDSVEINSSSNSPSGKEYGTMGHSSSNFNLCSSIFFLLSNPVYRNLLGAMSALYFTVTGVQYWGTSYLCKVLHTPIMIVNVLFIACAATGPTLGVFFGGWTVDMLGGYRNAKQRVVALEFCSVSGVLALVFAIPITLLSNIYVVVCLLWLILFFGAAVLPACSGIIVSIVPRRHRPLSSSLALVLFNLLGYSSSLLLSGYLMQMIENLNSSCDNDCALMWGFRLVLSGIFISISFVFLGLRAAYQALQAYEQLEARRRGVLVQ